MKPRKRRYSKKCAEDWFDFLVDTYHPGTRKRITELLLAEENRNGNNASNAAKTVYDALDRLNPGLMDQFAALARSAQLLGDMRGREATMLRNMLRETLPEARSKVVR